MSIVKDSVKTISNRFIYSTELGYEDCMVWTIGMNPEVDDRDAHDYYLDSTYELLGDLWKILNKYDAKPKKSPVGADHLFYLSRTFNVSVTLEEFEYRHPVIGGYRSTYYVRIVDFDSKSENFQEFINKIKSDL